MIRKPNKVLIVHGWEADSRSNWFPKAKKFLESKGYEVLVPDFPGNYFPKLENWLEIIKKIDPDEDWILIGHSLGGVLILRFLQETNNKVAQVVLTATPLEPMRFDPIANFFPEEWAFEKINNNVNKINLVYEESDSVVPLKHGQIFSNNLNASLLVIPGSGHLLNIDNNILESVID